ARVRTGARTMPSSSPPRPPDPPPLHAAAVLDAAGCVLWANHPFLTRFAAGSEVLGRPCHELVHGSREACGAAISDCPLRRCLDARRSAMSRHHHGDPAKLDEVTCIPLADPRGSRVERVLYITRPVLVP